MPSARKVSARQPAIDRKLSTPTLRRSSRRPSASLTEKVSTGRVERISSAPRPPRGRKPSSRFNESPSGREEDTQDEPQPSIESITNPAMIKIFGRSRPNPFFEALPRPPVYNSHNPAVLHIIDSPRAALDLSKSIDATLAKSKQPGIVSTLYDAATKTIGLSKAKIAERPPRFALPDVSAEETDKLMAIMYHTIHQRSRKDSVLMST